MSVLKYCFISLVLVSCAWTQQLRVAAAADLSAPMQKITDAFQKQTGIQVVVTLGSSGNFFAQMQNGAPFDVFLSADRTYPDKLAQAGRAEQPVLYARGKLVLWALNRSNLQISPDDLKGLMSTAVSKISIANPQHAPYGRAAVATLQHYGIYDQVKPKLVLGENVSQAAQFVQSGNADVGLIAMSLALSEQMQRSGHYIVIPQNSYPPLDQAGAVLASSPMKAQARRFLEFLRSPESQRILHEYGFESPQP